MSDDPRHDAAIESARSSLAASILERVEAKTGRKIGEDPSEESAPSDTAPSDSEQPSTTDSAPADDGEAPPEPAAADAKTEPEPEREKEKVPSPDEVIAQHIKLRRREQKLESELRRARQDREEIERLRREVESQRAEASEMSELLKLWREDPYKFAESAKLDPQEWNKRAIEANDPATRIQRLEKTLQEKLEALEKGQAEERERREAEAKKREELELRSRGVAIIERAVSSARVELQHLDARIADGEFTESELAAYLYDDIASHPELSITPAQALQIYEEQLEAQDRAAAERIEKLRAKRGAPAPVTPPAPAAKGPTKPAPETLRNSDAGEAATRPARSRSRDEAIDRILSRVGRGA